MNASPETLTTRRPNTRTLARCAAAAAALLLLLWMFWPDGKPPAPCENGIRPGQLMQEFDLRSGQQIARIMGDDCKPGARPASAGEIKAARERMARWQVRLGEESAMMPGAQSSFWTKAFGWLMGPVGTFFAVVLGLWLTLAAVGLLLFLLGFLVVAVIGLRQAPLMLLAAPVVFWWKVLIELPRKLALQVIGTALSKEEAGRLERRAWQALQQLLGLGKMEAEPVGDLGSAAFATVQDIRASDPGAGNRRAPLPIGSVAGQALTWHTDKHVFILAGSRSGKGRDLIIPNLLRYEGSVFVIDPKAENFRRTVLYRRHLGRVRVLDPWGKTQTRPEQRSRFNPLTLLSADNSESVDTADVLAHGLVLESGGGDPHWPASARALWKALLLHVATAPAFEGRRDLVSARQMLLSHFVPQPDDPFADEPDEPEAPVPPCGLQQMRDNPAFDGIIADFAASLLDTPDKERASIISYAARQSDFLDTPLLRNALAAQGEGELIDFAEWRRGIMSCYVCLPADKLDGSGLRWLRMIVSAALNEMTGKDEPPAQPVQFILDELAALKRLEPVERAVGLAAGYGVQIWSVWQDIAQMKDLYQSRWPSFIGNAGARYVFGVGDYDTAKYFSDYMGQATRIITAQQGDALGVSVSAQSYNVQTRALMTPDEVMMMGQRDMLVLIDRNRPLLARRTGWDEDPVARRRSDSGE